MAQIRIPCLVGKTNKAGVTSWYWQPSATLARAGWKPLSLGKDEGAAIAGARTRNAEVAAWKSGAPMPGAIKPKPQGGTVNALIDRYRRDVIEGINPATGKARLKPKTAETYEIALRRIEAWAGKHPVAYITPARVRALRDATAKPVDQGGIGHAPAFNMLKILRQLFAFAERVDIIPPGANPARSFDLGAPAPRRHVWEAEDEGCFITAAYALGLPGMALAMELALYTAQREGDLIAFNEHQLQSIELHDAPVRARFTGPDGEVMGWVMHQQKTSSDEAVTSMEIPFDPKLRAKVETAIRTNRARDRAADPQRLLTYVLVDDRTGLPWKKRPFIQAWRDVIEHAVKTTGRTQMRDLVWHDLRRTRVVRLRRRGMIPAMIASITGHSLQSINMMLKVYGPVDPTMTAAAIASTFDTPAKPARKTKGAKGSGLQSS
ncbi:hypothetical protein [Novosphingobium sp. FSW06-99]|uniref:hypothetical protein n=1 Tax=Novosphingobium sp. FSW06-99 TaxID=1739113 RepID=UPI00076BDE4E|nr:hypothetical protein [Novosphingobium sp. FSW06-99]KUR80946.1 hypothetical protein AQZ49_02675 [Novosphingobium sp. FSW06-99]